MEASAVEAIAFCGEDPFVYDLCVEGNHNYTVGHGRYHVHNSGKSHAVASKLLARMAKTKGERFLVVRKVAATLTQSCWNLILRVASDAGMPLETNKSERRIIYPPTGSEILMIGLDDPEKVKSVAGITGLWVEEATELAEADWNQLRLRVRGHIPSYKQLILTFNPIDESHWLKRRFFDENHEEALVIKTTYKDNLRLQALDPGYVQTLESYRLTDEYWYNVYCLGMWGNPNRGGEFYKGFSVPLHTTEGLEYDPALPLHLSFDFNVNPYCTCTVWQIRGKQCWQIDEVCLEDPRNNTLAVCNELLARYPHHQGGCIYTGDPAGKAADTRSEAGYNDFAIIRRALAGWHPVERVAASAPPVHMRGLWINAVFSQHEGGISVMIDRKRCPKTVLDYQNVKIASDGTKHKAKVRSATTKVQYEPYGHTSDANDYLLCEVFKAEFAAFQRGPKPKVPYVVGAEGRAASYQF